MIHLEIEVAANMAYEWAVNFEAYCEAVRALQILEHATGKRVESPKLLETRNELKESSDAIMAIASTQDFSELVGNHCLHLEMFYLGIAFITNAQVMQDVSNKVCEGLASLDEKNYIYVLNMEQNVIIEALRTGHNRLQESENETETQTQSESLEE